MLKTRNSGCGIAVETIAPIFQMDPEKRAELCARMVSTFPDRVPVLVQRVQRRDNPMPDITKHKFLVPKDVTVNEFLWALRVRYMPPIKKGMAFNWHVGMRHMAFVPSSDPIQRMHDQHKSADGFLYVTFSAEPTFGRS